MEELDQIYQSINAVSNKANSYHKSLNDYVDMRLDSLDSVIKNLQNALCEVTSGSSYEALAKVWKERIVDGDQAYLDMPTEVEALVIELLKADVVNEVLTPERYEEITGRPYTIE